MQIWVFPWVTEWLTESQSQFRSIWSIMPVMSPHMYTYLVLTDPYSLYCYFDTWDVIIRIIFVPLHFWKLALKMIFAWFRQPFRRDDDNIHFSNLVKCCQVLSNWLELTQITSKQIISDQNYSNRLESFQINLNRLKSTQIDLDPHELRTCPK